MQHYMSELTATLGAAETSQLQEHSASPPSGETSIDGSRHSFGMNGRELLWDQPGGEAGSSSGHNINNGIDRVFPGEEEQQRQQRQQRHEVQQQHTLDLSSLVSPNCKG